MGCYDVKTQEKFDYSFLDEKTSTWESASIAGTPDGTGYAVDTSGNVFKTDGEWERIGIRNAQIRFYDVYAEGDNRYVAAGDGRIYRYANSYAD